MSGMPPGRLARCVSRCRSPATSSGVGEPEPGTHARHATSLTPFCPFILCSNDDLRAAAEKYGRVKDVSSGVPMGRGPARLERERRVTQTRRLPPAALLCVLLSTLLEIPAALAAFLCCRHIFQRTTTPAGLAASPLWR